AEQRPRIIEKLFLFLNLGLSGLRLRRALANDERFPFLSLLGARALSFCRLADAEPIIFFRRQHQYGLFDRPLNRAQHLAAGLLLLGAALLLDKLQQLLL